MKTRLLLSIGLLTGSVMSAEPAPKLVPRPIPGLEAQPITAEPEPMAVTQTPIVAAVIPPTANPDQARVLYIHRRATLPAELTKDLPAPEEKPMASSHLQIRQGAVKIIPKSEVSKLMTSQN